MKRIILFACLFISALSYGQSYKTAIGLKGGYPGFGSLNVKHYLNGSNAIEASLGGNANFIWLQGIYEINKSLPTGGMNWYLGAGPSIGIANTMNNTTDGLYVMGTGLIGIEYTFQNLPINIALDTGPSIQVVPQFGFAWGGGCAIRYTLK
jgi:hypothetical protein